MGRGVVGLLQWQGGDVYIQEYLRRGLFDIPAKPSPVAATQAAAARAGLSSIGAP